jgi:hypothetical protein
MHRRLHPDAGVRAAGGLIDISPAAIVEFVSALRRVL